MYELNAQQKAAVEAIDGPILVTASAGTGKTRVLCERFLYMINNGIDSNKILCLTFSNQAANEMIKRINNNNVWIGTFHGICFRLLNMLGQVNQNTTIIDEYDQKKIFNKLGISIYMQQVKKYRENLEPLPHNLQEYYDQYNEYMTENNLIDFQGLLLQTIEYLEKNPVDLFDYIMIDEYQDTNLMQETLAQLLMSHKKIPNLFCVGDDDQCIYSWRGANIKNILGFEKRYPNVKVFKLEYNYRSTKPILNSAYNVICHNVERLDKRGYSNVDGDPVQIICSSNEPNTIANKIKKLNGNTGILVRATKQIPDIENALIKHNISYTLLSGNKFLQKVEIKHLIYYINSILHKDKFALLNVINFPRRGIGPKKIEILEDNLNTMEYFDAIRSINHDLGDKMEDLHNSKITDLKLIDMIVEDLFTKEKLNEEQITNIEQFKKNVHPDLNKVANLLQLELTGNIVEDKNMVYILTVHASKGMEFDNVIIPNFTEGVFPNAIAISEGSIDEERRLCYVAMTRAKKKLMISYSLKNNNFRFFGPSRFLQNLDRNDLQIQMKQ